MAAQAGIFSFFINYMTSEVPAIPNAWASGWLHDWFEIGKDGLMHISDKGASTLASVGFFCFLAGRFSGAAILKARDQEGPTILWCELDRLSSHTNSDDHRVYRSASEIEQMQERSAAAFAGASSA